MNQGCINTVYKGDCMGLCPSCRNSGETTYEDFTKDRNRICDLCRKKY